ncbi:MAG: prepilin-type N-terminal cleavage/methylation domain-containing protein [Candidatus Saccharimonas sp.]
MRRRANSWGFTIVEVMVVIVIIIILTAIMVFAFGTWRSRTATTEVKNALMSVAQGMKNERTFTGSYPLTVPTTYSPQPGVTVAYVSGSATAYCIRGTSTTVSTVVLYIRSADPTPSSTVCT